MRVWCVAVRWGVGLVGAVLVPVWASAQPILSVTPTAVDLQASVGTNPPSQTVTVSNAGSRALKWSVVPSSVTWVSVAPTSGVNTGTVTLTFNMAGLAAAQYQTSFTVTAPRDRLWWCRYG